MSDRSRDAAGNDSSEDAGTTQPGGGPRRVVSDQSVDDILASLDETTGADSSDGNAVTTPDGASESDGAARADETNDTDETNDSAEANDTAESDDTADIGVETATAVDSDPDRSSQTDSDATNSIDSAAASLPDDASPDELATRIERGDVTGADVRAAEAGDGREATPEIDEIELSMDDLEATETASTGRDDYPDDAGPLAGSIDGVDSSPDDDAPQEDDPGLFGRIKRLFSR